MLVGLLANNNRHIVIIQWLRKNRFKYYLDINLGRCNHIVDISCSVSLQGLQRLMNNVDKVTKKFGTKIPVSVKNTKVTST